MGLINPLETSSHYMHHPLQHIKTLHSSHGVYMCVCVCVCVYIYIYIYTYVSYGSHSKQRFFPLKSINRLIFVAEALCISCEVRIELFNILERKNIVFKVLKF
jgi:uncharacterized membrane protein